MSIKLHKKNKSGRRFSSVDDFADITKFEPEKNLIIFKKEMAGRSNGKITVRRRGAGVKRFIRIVDFLQDKLDQPAKIIAIEYDPNRGPRIALIEYADKERRYILAPLGLKVGDEVLSSEKKIEVKTGNRLPLEYIPTGVMVHSIELAAGRGGKMVRGAGLSAQLMAIEGEYAIVRLPSGEMRTVAKNCRASIGQIGNPDRRLIRWGKAGRMRLRGIRPHVRGKAMNPVDHPHGGGEGKHPIGLKYPKNVWGKPALGVKTRKRNKWSNKFIIQRRGGQKVEGAMQVK